ncbi:hypothetical protein BRM19_21850 [Xanthomonas oryzae pv. oryzae]|uniref:hypothetical protein n=1 Tax=Xanthomonas oryzae TaxID=347 RepID=UPI000DDD981E|nr:hypothetical protein [Xanthomonas oryzae]RBD68889.1 hypothetical protein BRM19_21850 [Xanthomonas oryzae pv. oryzae]
MTIKATSLTLATATELLPGAVFTNNGHWYLRVDISDRASVVPAAIPLLEGAKLRYLASDKCLVLAERYRLELRIIGPIKGPGKPDHTSLVWSNDGSLAVAIDDYFIAFSTGVETKDLNVLAGSCFAPHWGAWVIDAAGNQVGDAPLFIVNAATSTDAGTP